MSDINTNNIRKLDGALLLVFRELLRTRSATETAKRLALSQSAVSHSLSRLRDLFDDTLFLRRPHGFEPTRRALELGPKIDDLVRAASLALGDDHAFDPAETDRQFVFSAPEYVASQIGGGLVDAFQKEAPHGSFWCSYVRQQDAFTALRRCEIDVAVGRFDQRPANNITIEKLYEDEFCIVARKKHPRIKGRLGTRMLLDMEFVFATSESELTPEEMHADYSHFKTIAYVPQWLTAISIVAATDALTICPRRFAEQQAKALPVQSLKSPFEPIPCDAYIARRTDDNDEGTLWFAEQLRKICTGR